MWLPLCQLVSQMSAVPNLESLRWHHRVVVILAPDEADGKLKEQNQMLDSQLQGLAERDIRVFRVIGNDKEAQGLRDKLRSPGMGFAVVLVGKDGYVKLRKGEPLSAEALFKTIDAMPMLKEEMKERK